MASVECPGSLKTTGARGMTQADTMSPCRGHGVRFLLPVRRAQGALASFLLRHRIDIVPYEKVVRIGSQYGGWLVPDGRLDSHSICYCVGIGEDITFDVGLIERYGCTVHSFDPTPVAVDFITRARLPEGFCFHPVGLWSSDDELLFYAPQDRRHASYSALNLQATTDTVRCPVRRLSTLMFELRHDHLDLLKIDIEGAEYDVIDSILSDQLDVRTLCIEFHRDTHGLHQILDSVARLRAAGWIPIAAEKWNVTFIRASSHSHGRTRHVVPTTSTRRSNIQSEPYIPTASLHYQGRQGSTYFTWQNEIGEIGAELNLWKFEKAIRPTDRVIDFGCGNGSLLSRLSVAKKVGVEVNPAARHAAGARGLRVVSRSEELSPETADVVISNHALEHTLDPLAELKALRRALRPGGMIILWLPLDDWRQQRRFARDLNHHLFAWTPISLGNLLEEAGFEGIDSRVVTRAWLTFYRPLARVLPRPLYAAITFLTAVTKRRRQIIATAYRPNQDPDVGGTTAAV
jgi:FkbM family methyltransferase